MAFLKFFGLLMLLIVVLACIATFRQEKLIFFPHKLPASHKFVFPHAYQEFFIPVDKNTRVHGLLFKAENSRGLVFYLHGNAGSNSSWGMLASDYLENGFDFFVMDYRGFGKSEGKIDGEKQFHSDIKIVYDSVRKAYPENRTVIIGFSIGSGPAAYLASQSNPAILILKAPYVNLPDLATRYFRIFPPFLIRYKFRTDEYITHVKCPVVIFHGDSDEVIYTGSSYKLKQKFKAGDRLIILENQSHNGISEHPVYRRELRKLLLETGS